MSKSWNSLYEGLRGRLLPLTSHWQTSSFSILQISVTAQKRSCNTATCVTHRLAGLLSRSGGVVKNNFVPTNVGSEAFGRRRRDLHAWAAQWLQEEGDCPFPLGRRGGDLGVMSHIMKPIGPGKGLQIPFFFPLHASFSVVRFFHNSAWNQSVDTGCRHAASSLWEEKWEIKCLPNDNCFFFHHLP